jgi:hypothetical protein
LRVISSNTATVLTVSSSFSTNPDATSTYEIARSTVLTINNLSGLMTRYIVPADEIPDIEGTEEDQILLNLLGPQLKMTIDWVLTNESSSVASGGGGTVDSPLEQYLYLANHFVSKGPDRINDEYTFIVFFNSTAVTSGTASSGTSTTLVDSGIGWTANAYSNKIIKLTAGTGAGQYRSIMSNTTDTVTVDREWDTNPSGTTQYEIYDALARTGAVTDLTMTINDVTPVTVNAHLEFTAGQSL